MSATTRSQYQRHEKKITGRSADTRDLDQQLDSLLSDLNETSPAGRQARAAAAAPAGARGLVAGAAPLPGSEDFHEREEYTSPDQRTRTVEERSRRTARTDDGSQMIAQQIYKAHSSRSTQPAAGSPAPTFDMTPKQENGLDLESLLDQVDVSSKATKTNAAPGSSAMGPAAAGPEGGALLPELKEPLAPGQVRLTKYEYRSSKQRSVSPQPAAAPPPAAARPRAALPPPVAPKPRTVPVEPERAQATLSELSSVASSLERAPPPPAAQPGTSTTINYHIYNYGAGGPDGAADGRRPLGAEVSSLERHETLQQAAPAPQARPWPESNNSTVERYESRQVSSAGPQARPWPESNNSTVERYESRQVSSAGPQARPWPESNNSTVERYESRQVSSAGSQGRPPSPYDVPGSPSERYHARTVTTEIERTSSADRQRGALVPSGPQDGTYPDGPRRRDVTPAWRAAEQAAVPVGEAVPAAQGWGQQTAAPGVYYPPDDANCESKFQSKESHKNGNTKTAFKAKGKYKAQGGSKQKEAKGDKTIPICLPLCGGAACSVM